MDTDSLLCTEPHTAADTAFLLQKAMHDVLYFCTGSDSATSATSPLTSDGDVSQTKGSTEESTNVRYPQGQRESIKQRPAVAVEEPVPIPYTVPPAATQDGAVETNWADGFPFACPVVRDPTSPRGFYIPGEHLRLSHGTPLSVLPELTREPAMPEPLCLNASALDSESPPPGHDGRRISLQEAICQAPVRLSQLRDGTGDNSLYEAWLYGDPNESLRDRFARMDRGLRSKFIGLKNSSARVQEKMRQKKITTYKEVSDELVEEIGLANSRDRRSTLEAENLKRRIYDVLNVFEAVGMVTKDQRSLHWNGKTPCEDHVLRDLANTHNQLESVLESKRSYLEYTESSYGDILALTERNFDACEYGEAEEATHNLPFPFFIVHGPESAAAELEMAQTGQEVRLAFEGEAFEVSGDLKALRQMELSRPSTPLQPTFFQELFAEELSNGASATGSVASPTDHLSAPNSTQDANAEMEIDIKQKLEAPSPALCSYEAPRRKRSHAVLETCDDADASPTSNRVKRSVPNA